jgi:hypothetical protein
MSQDPRYYCTPLRRSRLLYWESYDDVHKALARETQLKGWTRAKKIALILRGNPHWLDQASEWYPWMAPDKERVDDRRDASTPSERRLRATRSPFSMTPE